MPYLVSYPWDKAHLSLELSYYTVQEPAPGVYKVFVRPYYVSSLSKGSSGASKVYSCIFIELTIFSFSCLCSLLSLSFCCSLDCKIEKEKFSFQSTHTTVRVLASICFKLQ